MEGQNSGGIGITTETFFENERQEDRKIVLPMGRRMLQNPRRQSFGAVSCPKVLSLYKANYTDPLGTCVGLDDVPCSDYAPFLEEASRQTMIDLGINTPLNIISLGGYGALKEAHKQGKLDKGGLSGLEAWSGGVADTFTLGGYSTSVEVNNAGGTMDQAYKAWAGNAGGYTDVAEGGRLLGEGQILEGTGRILEGSGKFAQLLLLAKGGYEKAKSSAAKARYEAVGYKAYEKAIVSSSREMIKEGLKPGKAFNKELGIRAGDWGQKIFARYIRKTEGQAALANWRFAIGPQLRMFRPNSLISDPLASRKYVVPDLYNRPMFLGFDYKLTNYANPAQDYGYQNYPPASEIRKITWDPWRY